MTPTLTVLRIPERRDGLNGAVVVKAAGKQVRRCLLQLPGTPRRQDENRLSHWDGVSDTEQIEMGWMWLLSLKMLCRATRDKSQLKRDRMAHARRVCLFMVPQARVSAWSKHHPWGQDSLVVALYPAPQPPPPACHHLDGRFSTAEKQ